MAANAAGSLGAHFVDMLQLKASDSNDCLVMFTEPMNGLKKNGLQWSARVLQCLSILDMDSGRSIMRFRSIPDC